MAEGKFDGVGEAGADALLDDEAVDDDLDGVRGGGIGGGGVVEVVEDAVDADADEACRAGGRDVWRGVAGGVADEGGEEGEAGAFGEVEEGLDHLLGAGAGDGAAAFRAVRDAGDGEEHTEEVHELGGRGDNGARVGAGEGALADGDGGGQALDGVDVGVTNSSTAADSAAASASKVGYVVSFISAGVYAASSLVRV